MNIGELFVNLGIKGSEKTIGALSNLKKGIGETKSMSLEAKAAIVGLMYEFQHLMSQSGKAGTNLTNFAALTGISAQALQKWQYAARQAGISGDEMTGSMKGVQQAMTNMLLGKGAPEGLGVLSRSVGFDPNKAKDTLYVMQKISEFAKKASPEMANSVAKSFGVGEGVIAAMRRGKFTPEIMNKAPTYSNQEIGQLDKANVAWENLGHHVEMAFGHFNAKEGVQLTQDISKLVDKVLKLAEAFTKLAEKLKLFQAIGKVFDGWSSIFSGLTGAVETVTNNKGGVLSGAKDLLGNITEGAGMAIKGAAMSATQGDKYITPPVSAPAGGGASKNNNTTIHQHFKHDGKDPNKLRDATHKGVKDAYRQNAALTGGQ